LGKTPNPNGTTKGTVKERGKEGKSWERLGNKNEKGKGNNRENKGEQVGKTHSKNES